MASSYLETQIRINVKTSEAVGNVEALNAAVKETLENMGRGADFAALEKLRQDAAEGKLNVSELDDSLRDLWLVYKKLSDEATAKDLLGIRSHQDIQAEIDATRAAYERLKTSGKLTSSELAQAAAKMETRIRDLEKQTNGWADSLLDAKTTLAGLGATGAGLVHMVSSAVKFESAMADVAKVVDGTEQQMGDLAASIKEMSTAMPLAATELAQIAAAGGQLGVPLEKLEAFVDLAAKMSTAFGITAEEAGQAVAKLSNVFSLPIEQVKDLGNAINVLGNTTAATEANIVEVLTRIGGTAKQFGLTAEQAAALGSTMLSLGVSSQVAGTGINALLTKLQTANIQGKDFQAALSQMGVSAQQLADDIAANPQKALTEFLHTLEKLDGAARAETLSRLFGVEYQDDIARLLGGLKQYEESLGRISNKGAIANAMQDEFDARVKTTEAQLEMLKNNVEAIAITLGEAMRPVINNIVSAFGSLTDGVRAVVQAIPGTSALVTVLTTTASAAGALKFTMATLRLAGVHTFSGIAAQVKALNVEIKTATLGINSMQSAITRFFQIRAAF